MPLMTSGSSARDDGALVSFSMSDGTRQVRCLVQQGALDAVEGSMVNCRTARAERFLRNRELFEAVASDLFDAGLPVRITADHVRQLRRWAPQPARKTA